MSNSKLKITLLLGAKHAAAGNSRLQRFGIQHRGAVRAQAEFDESTGIRQYLALPAIVGLVAGHSVPRTLVPNSAWLSLEIIFADQCFLNSADARRLHLLLPAAAPRTLLRTPPGGFLVCALPLADRSRSCSP